MKGAVLAGGAARRYGGTPKGLLTIGGRRILDRIVDAVHAVTGAPPLLIADAPDAQSWRPDLQTLPDTRPGFGTLGGIYTAVTVTAPAPVLCVAWDMPFVPESLLHALIDRMATGGGAGGAGGRGGRGGRTMPCCPKAPGHAVSSRCARSTHPRAHPPLPGGSKAAICGPSPFTRTCGSVSSPSLRCGGSATPTRCSST